MSSKPPRKIIIEDEEMGPDEALDRAFEELDRAVERSRKASQKLQAVLQEREDDEA